MITKRITIVLSILILALLLSAYTVGGRRPTVPPAPQVQQAGENAGESAKAPILLRVAVTPVGLTPIPICPVESGSAGCGK